MYILFGKKLINALKVLSLRYIFRNFLCKKKLFLFLQFFYILHKNNVKTFFKIIY